MTVEQQLRMRLPHPSPFTEQAVQGVFYSMYNTQKIFARSFIINGLGGNFSQSIDSKYSYTYPCLPVRLSGHFGLHLALASRFGNWQRACKERALRADRAGTPSLWPSQTCCNGLGKSAPEKTGGLEN
jgi:hypothetical protein